MMRAPIIVTLAHVDHGKTSLLDFIRKSALIQKEAGGITQSIGSTFVPTDIIEQMCSGLLKKFNFKLDIPGLLWIDTPGHAAFTTMRRRGGNIADIAVLLIDINEGVKPQTEESIEILKASKTPFVIAFNKIDRLQGWVNKDLCFMNNKDQQNEQALETFEKRFYEVIGELSEHELTVDRFDRITDFTKQVAAVPISAKTGEGIPDLLAIISGLVQQYLRKELHTTGKSKGVVLEVKQLKGMGTTLDTIIYDGALKKGDHIVIEGETPVVSKVRGMFVPAPLKDIRLEKKFEPLSCCEAATGVKIVVPGADDIIAGSEFMTASNKEDIPKLEKELMKERSDIEVESEKEGMILKADTIGGLEALLNIFNSYPVRQAKVGSITKKDIITAEANSNEFYKTVIGFNVAPTEDAKIVAKEHNIKLITADIIYRTIEDYEKWVEEKEEEIKKRELDSITRPGTIKILPGFIFRASNPAVVGCEVEGYIKPGYKLLKQQGNELKGSGEIKQIQKQGEAIADAKTGDKVAVSITGITIGRQVKESDVLYTDINKEDYEKINKLSSLVSSKELDIAETIKSIKKRL